MFGLVELAKRTITLYQKWYRVFRKRTRVPEYAELVWPEYWRRIKSAKSTRMVFGSGFAALGIIVFLILGICSCFEGHPWLGSFQLLVALCLTILIFVNFLHLLKLLKETDAAVAKSIHDASVKQKGALDAAQRALNKPRKPRPATLKLPKSDT